MDPVLGKRGERMWDGFVNNAYDGSLGYALAAAHLGLDHKVDRGI